MKFSDIVGFNEIKNKLIKIAHNKSISHAYLFFGPEGTPKLSLAIAFAQYLNCQNPTDNDSCGICAECKKYEKLIHPDLHFIFPVVKTAKISKPTSNDFIEQWRNFVSQTTYHSYKDWLEFINTSNLQATIYTEESKQIIKIVNLQRYEGKYKILIIFMPEKMHISAANKLLKVLEEPPEETLFFLISENPEQILPTILSRVQPIKINKPDKNTLIETFVKKFPEKPVKVIEQAIIASENNYNTAYKILNDENNGKLEKFFNNFIKFMRLAYSHKIIEIINFVEKFCTELNKEEKKQFIEYSLRQLRNNFISHSNENIIYLTEKEAEFAKKFKSFITEKNIFAFEQEFSKAYYDIERNGNDKLIFLDLILKTALLLHKT